jgi:hypothetical protein
MTEQHIPPSDYRFDSIRSEYASGYLEFILRTDIPSPKAIAYIIDINTEGQQSFCGSYGIHSVQGSTVADVKKELFKLIESGQ